MSAVWAGVKNCAIITLQKQLIIYTNTLKETDVDICESYFLCFGGMNN